MPYLVLIVYSAGDESHADSVARAVGGFGYDVWHTGLTSVGEIEFKELSDRMARGGPIVICGTARAAGSKWLRQVLANVQGPNSLGRNRVFPVRLELDADLEAVGLGAKVAECCPNFTAGIEQLKDGLSKHYPLLSADRSRLRVNTGMNPDYSHLPYDRRPVFDHYVDELDQKKVERFLDRPLSKELLKKAGIANQAGNISDKLNALGFVLDDHPIRGAWLCFAPLQLIVDDRYACGLQVVVYQHSKRASHTPDTNLREGNLLDLYDQGMSWLTKECGIRRRGRVGSPDRDELEIPELVLHEALTNALVHRDYGSTELKDQPNRLEVFPDRVEITSFGNLPDVVPLELLNRDNDETVSWRRNPVIARIFQLMSWVELNASGVSRMRLEMERASLAFPKFISNLHESVVRVVLARPSRELEDIAVTTPILPPQRGQLRATVSSSAIDLPEHRKQILDACVRCGVFPIGMEHIPPAEKLGAPTLMEMVDNADIFIGIYGWRYGLTPTDSEISLAEMEFNRAVERQIPILLFFMHEDHPVTRSMVELGGDAQEKLSAFKERAITGRSAKFFKSPSEIRGLVIHGLSEVLRNYKESGNSEETLTLHPPNIIPVAPQPYIAHPYSLLQTSQVVGRQVELNLLTDWVTTNKLVPAHTRIFNLVAIGGMGKSALTWKWFNDIAPNELPKLAGRMWWSFYESDAHWENFIIRALAYVSGQSEQAVRAMKSPEREEQLWQTLDQQPFLLVLDGLERILLAYARMDAAQMLDDDLDLETAHEERMFAGIPENIRETYLQKHRLRQCIDANAGRFLRRLASINASRILVSTRLYPAELQTATAQPWRACAVRFLKGLSDDDAISLWREFGVTGSRDQLLYVFNTFGNYPLLIRALAGEIAEYKPAPGNFDQWSAANPEFNPGDFDLKNAKTHVLEYALRGLPDEHRKVLHTIAAFRMPATWETLCALLVGEDKPCLDDRSLDGVLTELEDRGLMGWDKQANRYDLHPIVRGVVWATLASDAKQGLYRELHTYFDAAPRPPQWQKVESLEDVTPAVELFETLIGLERYKDACAVFRKYLDKATLYRLSVNPLRVELLERFFPDGLDGFPRLEGIQEQNYIFNALALAYHFGGQPSRAAPLFQRAAEVDEREKNARSLADDLCNLARVFWSTGNLWEMEYSSRTSLKISRGLKEIRQGSFALQVLGTNFVARGHIVSSIAALRRSLAIFAAGDEQQAEGSVSASLAEHLLWLERPELALPLAQRAWELAEVVRYEADFIRAARLHGQAALGLGDLVTAEERLQQALTRARSVGLVEEELPALTALAELQWQRKNFAAARELVEQVWAPAERGPYRLRHADARNVLARLEIDEGNRDAALAAATRAYELAWCDGPPYAYHFGLTNAKQLLAELGAPEPELPPFDESQFEPMPDVEINPKDEFWVDPATLDSDARPKPKKKPRRRSTT